MAAPIQYIAVPVGTAGGPEWRGIIARHGDQGYKVFWCASVLAELAAKADRGGLLAFASGQPKTALELCAELGVEAVWAAETLFPALERLGEGHWREEDGAWIVTSTMIARTLEWRGDVAATKALPAPKSSSGKLQFSRKLSDSEYKAWQRSCKLPDGVHLTKPCPKRAKDGGKCPVLSGNCPVCPNSCPDSKTDTSGHKRTNDVEDAEITENKNVHFFDNIKQTEEKRQQQKFVAISSKEQVLEVAIESLLDQLPNDCRAVVLKNQHLPVEVIQSNLRHLLTCLTSPRAKVIDNPGGWLTEALKQDYAERERSTQAKAQEFVERQANLRADAELWWGNLGAAEQKFWQAEGLRRGGARDPMSKAFLAWQADQPLLQVA